MTTIKLVLILATEIMKKIVLFILFFINFFFATSQTNAFVKKQLLVTEKNEILSFCDSIIQYTNSCLDVPLWFKIKVQYSNDSLFLWVIANQYLDSISYEINHNDELFSFSDSLTGLFIFSDYYFEITTEDLIEDIFHKTDSLIIVKKWTDQSYPILHYNMPFYCQYYGVISLRTHDITIPQKLIPCNLPLLNQYINKRKRKNKKVVSNNIQKSIFAGK